MKKLSYAVANNHMALASALTAIHYSLMNRVHTPSKVEVSGKSAKVTPGLLSIGGVFVEDSPAFEAEFPLNESLDIPANADSIQEKAYFVVADGKGGGFIVGGDVARGAGKAELPDLPRTGVVVAVVRVAVAPGDKGFVSGKDALGSERLTVTVQPVSTLVETFVEGA